MILGQGSRGRTRSQTRKISESGEEEKKPAVKRMGTMEQTIKVIGAYCTFDPLPNVTGLVTLTNKYCWRSWIVASLLCRKEAMMSLAQIELTMWITVADFSLLRSRQEPIMVALLTECLGLTATMFGLFTQGILPLVTPLPIIQA